MTTFGAAAVVALTIERAAIAPPSPLGYVTAATPVMLLLLGFFLFAPGIGRLLAPFRQQPTTGGESPDPGLLPGA